MYWGFWIFMLDHNLDIAAPMPFDSKRSADSPKLHLMGHALSYRKTMSVIISIIAALSLVLTGCSSGESPKISDKRSAQVTVQLNQDNCNQDVKADVINGDDSVLDPTKYSSREEYIEATGDYIVQLCNACNFRYPSIIYAQMFWEGGLRYENGQCVVSNIATQDHALFGIKAAGENEADWPYWDNGTGSAHSDGGNARSYKSFSHSILDYIDWLIRYKGNGISSRNGKSYASYAHGANDGGSGQEGLSILLGMGYCPDDYSAEAFKTSSKLTIHDSKVKISGEPKPLSQVSVSSNSAGTPASSVSSSSGEIIGDDVPQKVWNFFKAEGFTDEATAGILGNMQRESGVDPTCIQSNGKGPAAGIVQWESWSKKEGRWKGMADYASSKGKDWTDLQCQLEYILCGSGELADSLKTYSKQNCGEEFDLDKFKKLTDVDRATEVFEHCFERAGVKAMEERKAAAREFYERFKGTSGTNAGAIEEACTDDGNSKFGSSGIANGDDFAQIQGRHYHNGEEDPSAGIDDGARRSSCGATSFTVGVNMLLGQKHKYCGVETWHEMDKVSTTIGWESGKTKASDWLKLKGLDSQIEVTGINDIMNREALRQKLSEGNVCVVSSGGATVFKNKDGTKRYSGGHYILFYKYENGKFYANDCGSSLAGGGVEYTEADVDAYFNAPGRAGGSCSIKRK